MAFEREIISAGSSSAGNLLWLRFGDSAFLVDEGLSCRRAEALLTEAGCDLSLLRGIFVTHEHSDHIAGLPVFTKRHPVPVHCAGGTADHVKTADGCLVRHDARYSVEIGGVTVSSFPVPHDAACPVGYLFETPGEDGSVFRAGVATDLGYMTGEAAEALRGCDAVVLESNHDPEMLRRGPYSPMLKDRIASPVGHLSNGDCAAAVAMLCAGRTNAVLLSHLSEENNRPELALIASADALTAAGITGVTLRVAARCSPVRLL